MSTRTPKGRLLLIGGHEQRSLPEGSDADEAPDFILQRFVDELASKNTVIVIPTASEVPEEAAKEYVDLFPKLGVKHVEVLDIQSREQANHPDTLALLDRASGVMFTGGDQLRLTALLGGTQFLIRLRERYHQEPFVIAGTSAGAAAMSTAMIYQGRNNQGFRKDEIHLSAGLQLLPDTAIDTHFVTRGRIIRMAQIASLKSSAPASSSSSTGWSAPATPCHWSSPAKSFPSATCACTCSPAASGTPCPRKWPARSSLPSFPRPLA
jgi:cyanophycinase